MGFDYRTCDGWGGQVTSQSSVRCVDLNIKPNVCRGFAIGRVGLRVCHDKRLGVNLLGGDELPSSSRSRGGPFALGDCGAAGQLTSS